ncbi:MAG: SAM-dependent methyltransferase [Hyphomicrobiales bacterium]|nr:SAM-dependent methyltransferase [Hyphomicrobiales bacterium]
MGEYERWEGRYGAPEYVFGRSPSYFLPSCKPLLPKSGSALAIADGEGRNGVWLAEQGLDTLSIDFSPTGQKKAIALARERGVPLRFELADVHEWAYPAEAYDVVAEIFTQFSEPRDRRKKWDGMKRALKAGGLMIIQGYTPKQLEYGTGGPKFLDHLYTRELLEQEFAGWPDLRIVEEEVEMREGAHTGMSAVINMTAHKPG